MKDCVRQQCLNDGTTVDRDGGDDDGFFVDDGICFCGYLSYSMYGIFCDRDYKRHCSTVADVVAPCDVLMSIWC